MKKNTIITVILVLLILSTYLNYKLFVSNKYYRGLVPFLIEGEEIVNIDLIDQNAKFIDPMRLKKGVSVIFVFLPGCTPCDKNSLYWKRIAKLCENYGNKVSVTGVVLNSPTEAFNFERDARLNFKIYVPDNLEQYIREMRLMMNQSQTIVLQDGRVKMVKMGDMDAPSAIAVIKFIKGLIK